MSTQSRIPSPRQQGFTLIELACALVIMLLLLKGSLTLFNDLLPHQRLVSDSNQLLGLLQEARQLALSGQQVLVCAEGTDCSHFPVSQGAMLVIDSNHNFTRDSGESIARQLHLQDHERLTWHSFRNRPYLAYRSNGLSYFQNGHLLLCTPKEASKVVVNWIGRPRVEQANLSACSS